MNTVARPRHFVAFYKAIARECDAIPAHCRIMLITALQTSPADRVRAEELARAGQTTEAIALFERIVEANPADVDARIGLGMVLTRTGLCRKL